VNRGEIGTRDVDYREGQSGQIYTLEGTSKYYGYQFYLLGTSITPRSSRRQPRNPRILIRRLPEVLRSQRRPLILLCPAANILEVLTDMLGIEIDERTCARKIADPHGTEDVSVHRAHQSLTDDV